jgi:hypothetical protein
MKHRIAAVILFGLLAFGLATSQAQVGGGTVVASNGFEGVESWNFTVTGSAGAAVVTNLTGPADFPANARIRTGAFSWQKSPASGTSFTTNQLTFDSIDVATFTNRQVVVRVSSTSGTSGNGADDADYVHVYVALDGAAFDAVPDIRLHGNNNARWSYTATNFILTYAGGSVSNRAPQGGLNTNNYSSLAVDLPNSATSVAVRIVALNNSTSEFWNIDDVELHANAPGWVGAPDSPPEVLITTTNNTVPFATTTYDVEGTANVNTVGDLIWTNALAGVGGTTPAVASWTISGVSLAVGTNVINVRGTNAAGVLSQANVSIIRTPEPNLPPLVALSPTNTSYSVNAGAIVAFNVIGSQPPGDPGQSTAITGAVPVGATFTNVTGAAPVTSAFNWATSATGVFEAVFVVSDADGAVTQTVSITVVPTPLAADGDLVMYDFTGNSLVPSSLTTNLAGSAFSANNARTISFTGGNPTPAASATGWNVVDRYWEFTLTVASGYAASITNVSFNDQASASGATNWFLRTSVDGFAADVAAGPTSSDITASAFSASLSLVSVTGAVTFRIYGEGASSAAGTWRLDNVLLQGTTASIGGGGDTTLDEYDVESFTLVPGLVSVTVNVTSNGVPYSLLYTTNLLTAPVPTGTADTEVATGGPVTLQDASTAEPAKFYWIRTND